MGDFLNRTSFSERVSCRDACENRPDCTFSVYYFNGTCLHGRNFFNFSMGYYAMNYVTKEVEQTCWRRIPNRRVAPGCVSYLQLTASPYAWPAVGDIETCRGYCDNDPQCHHVKRNPDGQCILLGPPFRRVEIGVSYRMASSSDQLCNKRWRAEDQCIPNIVIKGDRVSDLRGATRASCRAACDANSNCEYTILAKNGTCTLMRNALVGTYGNRNPGSYVDYRIDQTCWRRIASKPVGPGCVAYLSLYGTYLVREDMFADIETCRNACDEHIRCIYVRRSQNTLCRFFGQPFVGMNDTNYMAAFIDQTCFKRNSADANCLPGVAIAGDVMAGSPFPTANRAACRQACQSSATCVLSRRMRDADGSCFLLTNPFDGDDGINSISLDVDQTCWKRDSYPVDAGCVAYLQLVGSDLEMFQGMNRQGCKQACDANFHCVFSIRTSGGACYLMAEPFTAQSGANLRDPYLFDQLCWRQTPLPSPPPGPSPPPPAPPGIAMVAKSMSADFSNVNITLDGNDVTNKEAVTSFINSVKAKISAYYGIPIENVVITAFAVNGEPIAVRRRSLADAAAGDAADEGADGSEEETRREVAALMGSLAGASSLAAHGRRLVTDPFELPRAQLGEEGLIRRAAAALQGLAQGRRGLQGSSVSMEFDVYVTVRVPLPPSPPPKPPNAPGVVESPSPPPPPPFPPSTPPLTAGALAAVTGATVNEVFRRCVPYEDFEMFMGMDHWGDDIARFSSVREAAANCTVTPSCAGFNTDGWTKRLPTITNTGVAKCFWRKTTTVCADIPGYTATANHQRTGTLLGVSPRTTIFGKFGVLLNCNASTRCTAMSSDGRFWSGTGSGTNSTVQGMCWYDKN
ncbi:hypothetical protein GPECTOR_47g382 [Gonium pectorale]|uniref:Apple domain-containing protein n=1 Tax=Gonium pectorale TaxID=33097 RepID=A0A150G968_GONPE|nr:hypothetical protein GPECTOR_47g382 [Gonium pectorale]|eukprot:KXZ46105.1 hypothetical protein GPECTOR_47g382 [Gonium pectorale]